MLPIVKQQIRYNITKYNRKIEWLVVHYTANYSKGADALTHFKYFNGSDRNASADFFVDDHEILQVNDYRSNYTWHCGDGKGKYGITNRNSIGIEMCVNSDGDFNKTLQNTIELVRYLMKELNIDINHVVRHYDASRKLCPLMFCGNAEKDKAWVEFKNKLKGIKMIEDWKVKLFEECMANGIITDTSWREKMDEPIQTWAVLAMLNNLYNKLTK
jgi:N-acetylmuramoyl-L-alanine amidase CwlA